MKIGVKDGEVEDFLSFRENDVVRRTESFDDNYVWFNSNGNNQFYNVIIL